MSAGLGENITNSITTISFIVTTDEHVCIVYTNIMILGFGPFFNFSYYYIVKHHNVSTRGGGVLGITEDVVLMLPRVQSDW